jgi:hypothetical protein
MACSGTALLLLFIKTKWTRRQQMAHISAAASASRKEEGRGDWKGSGRMEKNCDWGPENVTDLLIK